MVYSLRQSTGHHFPCGITEYDASEYIRFATGPGTGIGENVLDRCVQKIVEIEDEASWYQLAPYYAGAFVSALWTPDTWFATSITLIAGALGIAGKIGVSATTTLPITEKIIGWTRHGAEQAIGRDAGRGVSNNAIVDAVNNPVKIIIQDGSTIKYIGKNATVVLNQFGKVVTTWANNSAGVRGGK